MDIIATFPAEDASTKELFEQWKSMGASIDIGSEKRFLGGAEVLSAVAALTPLMTYLIGRHYEHLQKRKVLFEYRGVKVLAENYDEKKVIELLRHLPEKD
jgi:hypothetical protein